MTRFNESDHTRPRPKLQVPLPLLCAGILAATLVAMYQFPGQVTPTGMDTDIAEHVATSQSDEAAIPLYPGTRVPAKTGVPLITLGLIHIDVVSLIGDLP